MKHEIMRASRMVIPVVMMFCSCAAPRPAEQITFKPGTTWRELRAVAGSPNVHFSYVTNRRKYDLATLKHSPNPVLFENARLFAVLPPVTMSEFKTRIAEHLKTVELPFENGVAGFHSWFLTRHSDLAKSMEPSANNVGSAAEAAERQRREPYLHRLPRFCLPQVPPRRPCMP